jgi:hypothetical protein
VSAAIVAQTDYRRDLEALEARIAEVEDAPPTDAQAATRLAHTHYLRASMTGRLELMEAAERAVADGLRRFGAWPDLCLVSANAALALHRLDDVLAALALSADAARSPDGRCLAADVDLQRGRRHAARAAYRQVIDETGSWDALARLAHLDEELGDYEAAERLYAEA